MRQEPLNFSSPKRINVPAPDRLPDDIGNWVSLDFETDGLGADSMPVGAAVANADNEWYFPWAHSEGRQLQAANVRNWLQDNLAGKDVIFHSSKRDIEWARRWGLDLEAIGARPHEVTFAAALLDDYRRKFSLEELSQDRLKRGKLPMLKGEIWQMPADVVAPYARNDARLTRDLWFDYLPDIESQGLEKVLALENDLIWCTASMEREAAILDMPKLERWIAEVSEAELERVMFIHGRTGLRVNANSGGDMLKLFASIGVEHHGTFDDKFLNKHLDVPEVRAASEARDLSSLKSKYLQKYRNGLRPDGRLCYQLHQLRGDEYGTITGRFSSTGHRNPDYGCNIQQVMKPSKQRKMSPATSPWIIRELFLPESGKEWFTSDASQIEFRLLAHFSKSERLCREYNENPDVDFHDLVTNKILNNIMPRDYAKNFNFMKVYGGGVGKIMEMTGIEDEEEARRLDGLYDREFPEARDLMRRATRLAETRHYVKTILGRRRRFRPGDRMYSALNAAIQGSAADLMKMKLKRLYDERETVGINLRFTVHDEADGDILPGKGRLLAECLAEQEFELRVPITWDMKTGPNWSMKSEETTHLTRRRDDRGPNG